MLQATVGSFRTLCAYAVFDSTVPVTGEPSDETEPDDKADSANGVPIPMLGADNGSAGLNIGYTINLHLPATSDIAVFNAIFKSLRENLLR